MNFRPLEPHSSTLPNCATPSRFRGIPHRRRHCNRFHAVCQVLFQFFYFLRQFCFGFHFGAKIGSDGASGQSCSIHCGTVSVGRFAVSLRDGGAWADLRYADKMGMAKSDPNRMIGYCTADALIWMRKYEKSQRISAVFSSSPGFFQYLVILSRISHSECPWESLFT